MKIDTQGNWEVSEGLESRQIGVDPEAISKIVGLLSRRMYSFPHSAFREAWLNARESHAKRALRDFPEDTTQGQQVIPPVEIILPTAFHNPLYGGSSESETSFDYTVAVQNTNNRRFSIRDYGVGLSATELEELITNAGKSDKSDDNTFGGGMGIGSLAGFSVADQIVYTAYKDGLKSVLVLSSDSNAFVVSDPVPTDEPDGVQLSYVLRDDATAASFSEGAAEFLALAPVDERATIICDATAADILHNRRDRVARRGEHGLHTLSRRPAVGASGTLNIRIDGCFYRGEHKGLTERITSALERHGKSLHPNLDLNGWSNKECFQAVIWDVAPGYFPNISPNRETISLSKAEVDTFIELFIEYLDEYLVLAKNAEEVADELRRGALTASQELVKLSEFSELRSHRAFTNRGHVYSSSPDGVYASNFDGPVTEAAVAARANSIPYAGALYRPFVKGKHFTLNTRWNSFGAVALGNTVHIPGKALHAAHTVDVDGTTYRVEVETEHKADKKLLLHRFQADEGKTLLRVISSSNQLDQEVWLNRLDELASASTSKLTAEEKALVEKVTADDVQVVVSVPSAAIIDEALTATGVKVSQVGETVDGVALRKVYSKLFATRRKTTGTKYNVLFTPEAQSQTGVPSNTTEMDAESLSELGVKLIHSPIRLGGRYGGLSKGAFLSVIQAAHPGATAVVSRRTEQQSEKKLAEAVNFDGEVDDIDPEVALGALAPTVTELSGALDADSIIRLSRTPGAEEVGVTGLPEFSQVIAAFTGEDADEGVSAMSWGRREQRRANLNVVLSQLTDEQVRKVASEYVGLDIQAVAEADRLARIVLGSVNIASAREHLGVDDTLDLVRTVISKASADR